MEFSKSDLKHLRNEFHDKFYWGVIEDNNDPNKQGRYKVRLLGVDTPNTTSLPTSSLPWARSVNTAGLISGIGFERTYRTGTYCLVVLINDDRNTPVILGCVEGDQSTSIDIYKDPNKKYPISGQKDYELSDTTSFKLKNENAKIVVDDGITLEQNDGNKIRIESETITVTHKSGTSIEIDSEGNININCKKYKIQNDQAEVIDLLIQWIEELISAQMVGNLGAPTAWIPSHPTKWSEIKSKLESFKQ